MDGDAGAKGRDGHHNRRPSSDAELGFTRRPMVRWLDPHQLISTAGQVLASGFSTAYIDSRQLQALASAEVVNRSESSELWIDYAADLGDGWNSTYTVASLLAHDHIDVSDGDGSVRLPRGAILVLGGDQVYPVPTATEYRNRFLGPYRAAMPCSPPDSSPELFAIPGSHDWYDGLVNFMNIFCRQRQIGGWSTSQSRSYFAVKLPHRWWLWGIDLQFGDYLDEPQMAYFRHAAEGFERGDQIILCMAKEVESGRKSGEVVSGRDLADLEREVVDPAGARIVLYLKSGRHYYARYESEDGEAQLVTAGGGGAFLHPTHDLPELVAAPGDDTDKPYRRAAVYPSTSWSRRLRKRVWLLLAYNLPLAAALGAIQLLVVLMLNLHRGGRHRHLGFGDLTRALWDSPTAFVLIVMVVVTFGAMIRLAHDARGLPRLLIGLGHSVLQFGGLGLAIVVASALTSSIAGAPSLVGFLALVWVLGGVGGVLGVSGYLWATNSFGYHANEAYAPLHHMDQKNFLRLHIDAGGVLTLHPIGVDRVSRAWRFDPEGAEHEPWLVPSRHPLTPHLIERPIDFVGPPLGGASGRDGANRPRRLGEVD